MKSWIRRRLDIAKQPFGTVLIHGISATPENLRPVAPFLAERGLTGRLPTLRCHGAASPLALKGVEWQDWIEDGEMAMQDVLEEAEKVIFIGHSMGSWIAMNLATGYPEKIDSIVVAGASTLIVSPLAPFRPLHFVTP